jgi:hypothetical protein
VEILYYRELGQEDRTDSVTREPTNQLSGCLVLRDGSHRKGEVSDHAVVVEQDEDAR